jgi:hypothetical protein
MGLDRFGADELRRFLAELDRQLDAPAAIVIIGGSALVLGYRSGGAAIAVAAAQARVRLGLHVPIADSSIAELPLGYETRMFPILEGLSRLTVYVVERHDLAASKLLRGNAHDRQQLAQLPALRPLDLDVLVSRFGDLLRDAVGEPAEARWALRHLVEELWGEIAAIDAFERVSAARSLP